MVVHTVTAHLRPDAPAGRRRRSSIDGVRLRHLRRPGRPHRRASSPTTRPAATWAGPRGRARHRQRVRPPARSSQQADLARLIRGDLADRRRARRSTPPRAPQVTVVDLHNLPDRAQRFVVGVMLAAEFERKEKAGTAQAAAVRRCSTSSTSTRRARAPRPIKEVLLDIAERGRSLGIILIGAQQTAQRGGAADRRPTRRSGWSAGSTRPRPAGPSTASCRRPSAAGHRSPSRAPCSSPSPRSRCRSWSSSRSRPGPPGPSEARPAAPQRHGGARTVAHPSRPTRSPVPDLDDDDGAAAGEPPPFRPHVPLLIAPPHSGGTAVKFLHTSDWHVGKVLKGQSRLDEQRAGARARSSSIAPRRTTSTSCSSPATSTTPPPRRAEAQKLVDPGAARRCAARGAEVVAIAGNHDHGATLDAYAAAVDDAGITLRGTARARPTRAASSRVHRPVHRRDR